MKTEQPINWAGNAGIMPPSRVYALDTWLQADVSIPSASRAWNQLKRTSTGLFLTLRSENKSTEVVQHVIGINNQQSLSHLTDSSRLYSGWSWANSAPNTLNKESLLNCAIAWRTSSVVLEKKKRWKEHDSTRQLCEALKNEPLGALKFTQAICHTRQLVPSFIAFWKSQIHWTGIYLLQVPTHFIADPGKAMNGSIVLLPKQTANATCPWHVFLTISRNKTAATKTIYSATASS